MELLLLPALEKRFRALFANHSKKNIMLTFRPTNLLNKQQFYLVACICDDE